MRNYSLVESCLFLPANLNKRKLRDHLNGKSILITGASSGIGAQLALQLATINCHLILIARSGDKLVEIKNEIERKAANVTIFQADLRNEAEMEELLKNLHALPDGLDIVVSNAGLSINRSIYDSLDRYHDFTRTMAINYFAPVQLLLSTIPILEKNQGHIINISTINALLAPLPYFAAYQASKTAFDVWLRSISPELKRAGIATTSLYLPLVKTPMIQPTAAYHNMPAMSPEHVTRVICKSMYTHRKKYQPWWLLFGQLASVFLRSLGGISPDRRK
ncbi:SDR family NAD(P)-dependent oxidoreductase [Virgibacillus flavescens]|uniref:SDR family NAD(P)-dependent oxidoreductase n=1 Tax=Virgibacillus flavescens TaxID=1611422 RepID=UPI003D34B344